MSHLMQGIVSFMAALFAFAALTPNEEPRARAALSAAILIGLLVGLR